MKFFAAAALAFLALAGPAQAQPAGESPPVARTILMRMAAFLAGAQRFSVSLRGGYDTVQASGQKIEFGERRTLLLSRPDRLRVESERSDGTKALTVFSGKEIFVFDAARNVYATAPQPGDIDRSIAMLVGDLGMRLPLSPLLLTGLPANFDARVRSVDYVEKTSLHGAPSHHLAARTDAVDFQIWVADGDQPLPLRVVITYRKVPGQPQYWAQFSDWNLAPTIGDAAFLAQAPAGAKKIAFAAQLARTKKATAK
jgi:hypothetical protein